MPHVMAGSPGSGPQAEPVPGRKACLDFFAGLAAGVAVVTASTDAGPVGTTVSTVTSLSAEPPLLLLCLAHASRTLDALRARDTFAVHLLAEGHAPRARRFSSAAPEERFAAESYEESLGAPVLADTLRWSVCRTEEIRPYGDHCLVVGRLTALCSGPGRPLVWHDRAFHALAERGAP
ncbi:flavin reductase family protein [Streptomyces spiramenti]|uniref:Flavin reductase n=1 Tax=Streptomyces spiramenti TaxID=2720606 RepID=A0ABX1AM72_9ACTN|nr:flavin reductase family protein [Streptomyces spiramenti]NJP66791.1 flavin reductase [Streptomyces spiramenti]